MTWATEPEAFDVALRAMEEQNLSIITQELADAIFGTGLLTEPIPVSAKANSGLVELNAALTRTLSLGEEESH